LDELSVAMDARQKELDAVNVLIAQADGLGITSKQIQVTQEA
jgi:hypothetical protein